MEPIILASGSPRRQEYFRLLGLPFTIEPADIDESAVWADDFCKTAEGLAARKALAVVERMQSRKPLWVFGADTVVALDGGVLGKPGNRDDAERMLRLLSGREHRVISAMALYSGRTGTTDCRSTSCAVTFAPLTDAEIEWYADAGEWQGAAGAYRLQGLAGCFIASITGQPSAVAGLPLRDFYDMLRENGYPFGASVSPVPETPFKRGAVGSRRSR